jgi:hypothetical protein
MKGRNPEGEKTSGFFNYLFFEPDLSGLGSLACKLIRRRGGQGRNRVGVPPGLIFGCKKPVSKQRKTKEGGSGWVWAEDLIFTHHLFQLIVF